MKKELIILKKKKKKSNLKAIILILILLCLSIGYAIYTQELEINGQVEGSARFKVYFIEAWVEDASRGTAEINTTEGADRVDYSVELKYPGDKVLIGTKIKNDSSISVKLNDFVASGIPENSPYEFDYIELDTTNERLDPGAICDYRFVISWKENCSNADPGPIDFSIDLDYEQDTDNPEDPYTTPIHSHGEGAIYTAFLDANGGEVSIPSKQITNGHTYGELPTPTRTEYTFLGWYTAIENGTIVASSDIVDVDNDITLHALWSWDGHSYGLYSTIQPATCTEEGEEEATCSVCGNVSTRKLSALGHNFTEEVQEEDYLKTTATCTVNGEYYKSCSRCSTSSKNITNATFTTAKLEHSYTAKSQTTDYLKQSAQCSGTGVVGQYYYKCATCTASSKGATNTYYSTGTVAHSYQSTTSATNNTAGNNVSHLKSSATCQAKATYYTSCKWCGANSSTTFTSGSLANHSYTASCDSCKGNGYSWISANANWYYCPGGAHCIAINHCDTHNRSSLKGGYRAIRYCTKCCKKTGSLYYPLSNKGSGKQCKWCKTGYKT